MVFVSFEASEQTKEKEKQGVVSFGQELRRGGFLKRYKRFFVDVKNSDEKVDVLHCPNSGSMKSCLEEGAPAFYSLAANPNRKLPYTFELLELKDGFACLNTNRANDVVFAFLRGILEGGDLIGFPKKIFQPDMTLQKEVIFRGKETRFDFCLSSSKKRCWIEVKSVSYLCDDGFYAFPDAVTERGLKHIEQLIIAKEQGDEACLIFMIMRGTNHKPSYFSDHFRTCNEIDPAYAEGLKRAQKAGVTILLGVSGIHPKEGICIRHFYPFEG